jgi:hypothetical protein
MSWTWKDVLYLSGDVFLPKRMRTVLERYHVGNDRSLVYVTNWSILHFFTGFLVGILLMSFFPTYDYYWTGFWVHTIWEIWQILVSNTPWWTTRGQIDVVVDTLIFMLGMVLASAGQSF